jgi:enterochelin esterase-like enzyme
MLKRFFASALLFAASLTAQYALGPDSQRHEGVPHGAVTKFTWTSNGGMYPGIQRDYWVYVPPQYSAGKPAALMVFQDGAGPSGKTATSAYLSCSTISFSTASCP